MVIGVSAGNRLHRTRRYLVSTHFRVNVARRKVAHDEQLISNTRVSLSGSAELLVSDVEHHPGTPFKAFHDHWLVNKGRTHTELVALPIDNAFLYASSGSRVGDLRGPDADQAEVPMYGVS
jgi:hypothetical protein